MSESPACVYRAYDSEGTLLYIGTSTSPGERFGAHKRHSKWWPRVASLTIEHHPSKEAARVAEWQAITEERPPFNRQGSHGHRVPVAVRIERCKLDQFREIAKAGGVSMQALCERMVDEWIAAHQPEALELAA